MGTVLPDSQIVRVTDESGDPVSGVSVAWAAQGGGSVSDATVQTGDDGLAGIKRTLGPAAGTQGTTATVADLEGSPVTFSATAEDGPPPEPEIIIVTQPPATALDGEVFAAASQPVVRVEDGSGNPIAGATVTAALASGSGTLEGATTAVSGSDGVATFGDLGVAGQGNHTIQFTGSEATATSSAIALSALPAEANSGEWGPQIAWSIVPLHISLLPTGKVLAWGREEISGGMGQPRLWDPTSGAPTAAITVANDTMLFCAGHALMPDGNVMVSGGHKADDRGLDVTNIFNVTSETWTPGLPKMAHGRWYPTVTTLPDGRLVTVAGQDSASNVVRIPEIWENNAWVELPGAGNVELPYYPRDFVDPLDGRLFMAGERVISRWLDVDGSTSGQPGELDATGPDAHLAVQSRLRLGGDVRVGEDPLRRWRRVHRMGHARSQVAHSDGDRRKDRSQQSACRTGPARAA